MLLYFSLPRCFYAYWPQKECWRSSCFNIRIKVVHPKSNRSQSLYKLCVSWLCTFLSRCLSFICLNLFLFVTASQPSAYPIHSSSVSWLSPRGDHHLPTESHSHPGFQVSSSSRIKKTVPKYYSTYQQRLLVANAVNPPLTGVAEHPAFLDNALRLGCCLLNRHGRHLVFRLSRPAAFRMLGDGIVGWWQQDATSAEALPVFVCCSLQGKHHIVTTVVVGGLV